MLLDRDEDETGANMTGDLWFGRMLRAPYKDKGWNMVVVVEMVVVMFVVVGGG